MIITAESMGILLTIMLVTFVVMPLPGGLLLWLSLRYFKVTPKQTYVRCWLAYLASYAAASVLGTILVMVLAPKSGLPWWLGLLVFAVGLALHFALVPLVLKKPKHSIIKPQAVALVAYAVLLAIVITPTLMDARSKARKISFQSDLRLIGVQIIEDTDAEFPLTLEEHRSAFPMA